MDLSNKFEIEKWKLLIPELDRNDLEDLANTLVQQNAALKEAVKLAPFILSGGDWIETRNNGSDGLEPAGGWDAWGIVLPHG